MLSKKLTQLSFGLENLLPLGSSSGDSVPDPDSKFVVHVREENEYIDVRTLDGVEWNEEMRQFEIEYKIPMMHQDSILSDTKLRSKFDIERRADGTYLTQRTACAETAHAISRFMKVLWDGEAPGA